MCRDHVFATFAAHLIETFVAFDAAVPVGTQRDHAAGIAA